MNKIFCYFIPTQRIFCESAQIVKEYTETEIFLWRNSCFPAGEKKSIGCIKKKKKREIHVNECGYPETVKHILRSCKEKWIFLVGLMPNTAGPKPVHNVFWQSYLIFYGKFFWQIVSRGRERVRTLF